MITRIKIIFILLCFFFISAHADTPIFQIQLEAGSSALPSNIGLYDPPTEHFFTITNQTQHDMTDAQYFLPSFLVNNTAKSTCGSRLNKNSSCRLALILRPNQLGNFSGELKVCGGNGIWCSRFSNRLRVSITNNEIVSHNCNQIQSRPFGDFSCNGSKQFSDNFESFLQQVLNQPTTYRIFRYFQHRPSVDETTVACLNARQPNVPLDPNIQGGGVALCELMGYAIGNASPSSESDTTLAKQFPPYLTRLLGTSYPITSSTTPLDQLDALRLEFDTVLMDASVQSVGYTGHVNFLSNYYQEQLAKTYTQCGLSEICASIFYLPYQFSGDPSALAVWPPLVDNYWGMSGGGGSGAGYQIQAFKSGDPTHYTLFTGGGGGGGGNTTPEGALAISLINTGSGGGGGNQFADCYLNAGDNLNGLGLGAGTGSGVSTLEGTNVTFQPPPAVEYSFYPPSSHPTWDDETVLTQYADNLSYLFDTLIPALYNQGYTIAVTGGGGGGTGLEFLNIAGEEFTPHPVSIGYGFNFCYIFNKAGLYTESDCVSAPATVTNKLTLDQIIYQNLGELFHQGMQQAILPQNCNGYTDYSCTCTFQHAYVLRELTNILVLNGFSSDDVPSWLLTPHCSNTETLPLVRSTSTCIPPF